MIISKDSALKGLLLFVWAIIAIVAAVVLINTKTLLSSIFGVLELSISSFFIVRLFNKWSINK